MSTTGWKANTGMGPALVLNGTGSIIAQVYDDAGNRCSGEAHLYARWLAAGPALRVRLIDLSVLLETLAEKGPVSKDDAMRVVAKARSAVADTDC